MKACVNSSGISCSAIQEVWRLSGLGPWGQGGLAGVDGCFPWNAMLDWGRRSWGR